MNKRTTICLYPKHLCWHWLVWWVVLMGAGSAWADTNSAITPQVKPETVFTYRAPESDRDTRLHYEISVLQLALEKTVDDYGPFRLESTPRINVARCMHSIRQHKFTNFFCSLGYTERYNAYPDVTYVRFPIELGVLSYRTCFTNPQTAKQLQTITTMDQLRQLTQGLGRDWADVAVFKHNGFSVVEVDQYEALFSMVAAGRFNLFCRGTNEVKDEYNLRHGMPGLVYDRTLAIHYPMPLLLYTNKANAAAIERITKGLQKAFADGSLVALWKTKHLPNAEFAQLHKRRLFHLENPAVKSIDFDYEKYDYTFLLTRPLK